METLAGMTPTGRRFAGPGADLVELDAPNGLKHTAIVFHPEYRQDESLTTGLPPVMSFLEKPMVTGLVGLAKVDPEQGAFVYPTGTVWSVAEIVRKLADLGRTGGVKAGLELMYLAANTLLEAAETGSRQGVYSHGALSPWRILVKADGQVQIIGYGLPMVEILAFREDESLMPREDSFRYCPPERLEGQPEDVSSDLFGLALIGFELITGRPVYDGLASDIRQQAMRAEGSRRLYQLRDQLPETVREVLGRALKFDPDTRFPSANDFVYAVHDLLSSPDAEGPALIEIMQKVRGAPKKGQALMGGQTGTLTREQLAALRAELEEAEPKPLPPPSRPRPSNEPEPPPEPAEPQRWGRVARPGQQNGGQPVRGGAPQAAPPQPPPQASPPSISRSADQPRPDAPRRLPRASDGEGPRRIRGADEGPRRIRAEDPRQAAPAATGAEALLERLRTSQSRDAAPTPRQPEPPPRQPEPRHEAPRPEVREPPRPEPVVPEPPVQRAPEPPVQRAPEPPPRAPEPPPRAPDPPPRAPEPQLTVSRSGDAPRPGREELTYFQVSLEGGPPQRTRMKTSEALAETANRLVQAIAAPPTDLAGNATGWFRFEQEGKRWRGDQPVAVLDPERPVTLAFVPNRTVRMEITVDGASAPIRFQAPVGTAVPVRSLVAHLVRWLSLPEGQWALFAGGTALGPMQILEELEPGEGFPLVLRR